MRHSFHLFHMAILKYYPQKEMNKKKTSTGKCKVNVTVLFMYVFTVISCSICCMAIIGILSVLNYLFACYLKR